MPNYLDHIDIYDYDNHVVPVMLMDRETSALANLNKQDITKLYNDFVYIPAASIDLDNTGTVDCSGIFSNATDNIGLKAGTYLIEDDCTIDCQLVFARGAKLLIANGVTVTINGQILAGRYQIFDGAGSIVVNPSDQSVGFPEWFGAVPDDTTDSTTAIQNCIDTFSITDLAIGKYKITDTLVINRPNKEVRGANKNMFNYNDQDSCTTIYAAFNGTAFRVGNDVFTTAGENLSYCKVNNLIVFFDETNYYDAIGFMIQYTFTCMFDHLMVYNAKFGYQIKGTVNTKLNDCNFWRNTASDVIQLTSGDVIGFYINGTENIGLAGSNASLFIQNCNSTCHIGNGYSSRGFYADGSVADIFIESCEVSGGTSGFEFNISGNSLAANSDVKLSNCISDGTYFASYNIHSSDTYIKDCMITIVNCWGANIASADASGTVMICNYVRGVTIIGGDLNGLNNERDIYLSHCKQINIKGTKVALGTYGIAIEDCDHCTIFYNAVGSTTPLYVISGSYLLLHVDSIGGTNINIANVSVPASTSANMNDYIVDTVRLIAPISI